MKKIAVIGAGIGGLTLANLLIDKGHEVTLFESHSNVGGYTAGFWRKGFYFESGTLSFENSTPIFDVMKQFGVYEKIDFAKHDMRIVAEGTEYTTESYGNFKQELLKKFPEEEISLKAYFKEVDKMYHLMYNLMFPKNGLSTFFTMIGIVLSMIKYGKMTSVELAKKFFKNDCFPRRLFSNLGYPEMSAFFMGGTFVSIFDDYWNIISGMQKWADVLKDRFIDKGGNLMLKTRITRINIKNKMVCSVQTDNAEYEVDYAVSAADYKKTVLDLVRPNTVFKSMFIEKVKKTAVSEGFFAVYLALDMTNEQLAAYMKMPHVSIADSFKTIADSDSLDPDFFEKTRLSLYSPSMTNSELAPKGKSSLMFLTTCPYRWMNNWGGGDRAEYNKLKRKVKEICIAKASKLIPGLQDKIIFSDAATPLTYERYTGNTDGATSAWSWNPNKKFYKNFMTVDVKTPIKNLLMSSCWTAQIGGVPNAITAAQKCSKIIG